jgi:hypothetical protein
MPDFFILKMYEDDALEKFRSISLRKANTIEKKSPRKI